uniref:Uncharacterized protein n=1 Tax=Otus sunia TaxID=257818 RepID=A0A8C8EEM0_9STRI
MGCCFSKELSNSTNEEKTGLLQKSVEEEAQESRISKTLYSILGTVESQDLMENIPCENSRRPYDRPFSFFNSFSHLLNVPGAYGNLQKSVKKKDRVIKERAPKKSNSNGLHINNIENINSNINNENVAAEEHCLFDHISTSHVPDVLDKGLWGEISLNRNFLEDCAVTCDHSRQNVTTVNLEDSKSDSLQNVSSSYREMSPTFYYLDVDNRQNTKDREFYSICVVDAEDLKGDEEVPATVHEETAAVTDNSAVTDEGMCNMARPLDTGEEFPMQQSAQVGAKFNSQKELFEYKKEDRANMQKKETKQYCSTDIRSSYDNLLADRCQVHRLNTDNTVTDGLRVKIYDDDVPEKKQVELYTIGNAVSWNESLHSACDHVKFADAAEEHPYNPNSENVEHSGNISSVLLNTGVCNSGKIERSHDSEIVPFGLSRHPSSVVRETNTEQVAEKVRGNFKLSLELHEMDNDSFLVSQHAEKLAEDYVRKPESEVNSNVEERTLQRMYDESQKLVSDSSEHYSVLEEFLKDKEKCTGTVLHSVEALNMTEIKENLEESPDFQTQNKSCTANKASPEGANHSGMEEDVCLSIIDLKGNMLEQAGSLSRTCSWVSDGTLAAHELHNRSADEMFLNGNSLESQISQESPGNKGKVSKYSKSHNKNSVSSVSLEHKDMNKVDVNCRQDERQDVGSFHAVENQWNVGTESAKIAGDVVESVKQTKFEVHLNETIDNEVENVEQNLGANIDSDKNILNCSKGLTHDQNTYSNSTVPVALDNCIYKSVKLIDDTKNLEDASNLFHKDPNCLPSLCQNSYSHVHDKQVEELELCHCASPEPEVRNTHISVRPYPEIGSETHEKSVCDVNECEVKQCVSIHSGENLIGFNMSTGNLEAFTMGNLKQLEVKTTELKNSSYILNTQTKDLTTSWERTQSDHKIFSNKELGVFVDPKQVDKYAATPSYEIHSATSSTAGFQQSSEQCVLGVMEGIPSDQELSYELDRQNPQVEIWSHFINLQIGNADGTNQLFSDTITAGNGEYLMSFLWNNTISNNAVKNDRLHIVSENFQKEPEDLTGASYAVGKYPYQLLAPENVDTWGWQDKDEFVSILQK